MGTQLIQYQHTIVKKYTLTFMYKGYVTHAY